MLKNLGRIMIVVGCIALVSETPETGPIIHQLYLWLFAALMMTGGYQAYRWGGGTFRFRDLFSE